MTFQHREGNKQHKLPAVIIRPQHLPQPQHVVKRKLALERDEYPAEAEEEVEAVGFLEVPEELGVHDFDELLEGEELLFHAALVTEEVLFLHRKVR